MANGAVASLLMLLGTISFTAENIFAQRIPKSVNNFQLIFLRALIQFPVLLALMGRRKVDPLAITRQNFLLLAFRCCSSLLTLLFYIISVRNLPLSVNIILLQTITVFSGIFNSLINKEKWASRDQIGCVVCMLGVVFIVQPSWLPLFPAKASADKLAVQPVYVLCSLTCAALSALASVIVRRMRKLNVLIISFWSCVVSMLSAPITLLAATGSFRPFLLDVAAADVSRTVAAIFGVSSVALLAQILVNRALQMENPASLLLISSMQFVFLLFYDMSHRTLDGFTILGIACIAGFTSASSVWKWRQISVATVDEPGNRAPLLEAGENA